MKKLRRIISWMLTFVMVLGICQAPFTASASTRTANECIADLIGYYKSYQESAVTDIERVLDELKTIDEAAYEDWKDIMDFWSFANTDMEVSIGVGPDGMPTDDSLCIVVLGFALNADGTMKEELINRLRVGLATAEKYPNAYVAVTGGGTAANNPNVTEGGLMGDWLLEQGLDPNRLIVENRAPSTVGNALNTYTLLVEEYPQVDSVCMVTSDYHVPRGCIIFNSKFVLAATDAGTKPISIVGYAGCDTGSNGYESISLQASGVSQVAGISASADLTLSALTSLTVKRNAEIAEGNALDLTIEANYDTGYVRDVTDLAVVEGFDVALGANQTVSISYTENDITVKGNFTLSDTEKVIYDYIPRIEALLLEADANNNTAYTAESLEILNYAAEYAKQVLAKEDASDDELKSVYEALEKALAALAPAENIALKKPVTASHNASAASKITDGNLTNYWEGYENSANVPIEDTSLVIDLQGIYAVSAITAFPYFQTNNRYYHYDIFVSADNETWTKVAEQRSMDYCQASGATFELETAMEVRYVKIEGVDVYVEGRTDINNLHMNEVKVYGELVEEVAIEKTLTNVAHYGEVIANEGTSNTRYLTDGTIANSYSNSNAEITDSFAVVALPGECVVEEVRVVTYYNNSSKWYNWEVFVSNDNSTWTSVGKYEVQKNPGSAGYTVKLEEPTTARFVKVQGLATNNNYLHLVEIEVYGTAENIAEGKAVTTNKDGSTGSLYKATDGVLSSYWDAGGTPSSVEEWPNVAEEDLPYAVVDLGALYELDIINVLNYVSSSRYYQYRVYTSVDGEEFTLVGQKENTDKPYWSLNYTLEDGTIARYIKVVGTYNSANTSYHINEIRATGTLVPEGPADYSAVEAALAKVPADLSIYTAASVVDLKIALLSVKEGLTESRQSEVDTMAKAIEDAIAALEEIPAEKVFVELVTQPVDVVAEKGTDAVVTFEAIGDGLTYTWYYKNPGNVKFYASGTEFASGNTYTIPMYAWRDGQQVYCVVADEYGNTAQTNTVTLSMKKADIEIVTQPEDAVVAAYGDIAEISVEAKGKDLTYTWYYKNPGNVKFYESGEQFVNGNTYEIQVQSWRDGQQVYCVITNAAGESVQTDTVTLSLAK